MHQGTPGASDYWHGCPTFKCGAFEGGNSSNRCGAIVQGVDKPRERRLGMCKRHSDKVAPVCAIHALICDAYFDMDDRNSEAKAVARRAFIDAGGFVMEWPAPSHPRRQRASSERDAAATRRRRRRENGAPEQAAPSVPKKARLQILASCTDLYTAAANAVAELLETVPLTPGVWGRLDDMLAYTPRQGDDGYGFRLVLSSPDKDGFKNLGHAFIGFSADARGVLRDRYESTKAKAVLAPLVALTPEQSHTLWARMVAHVE